MKINSWKPTLMLFNSFIFFIFLGVVLPVFYFLPSKRSKNLFLLFSSYIFYGYWDWRFCLLLLISTLVDFSVGSHIARTKSRGLRKRLLWISLFSNLGILGFFKYFNFFADSFSELSNLMGYRLDDLRRGRGRGNTRPTTLPLPFFNNKEGCSRGIKVTVNPLHTLQKKEEDWEAKRAVSVNVRGV